MNKSFVSIQQAAYFFFFSVIFITCFGEPKKKISHLLRFSVRLSIRYATFRNSWRFYKNWTLYQFFSELHFDLLNYLPCQADFHNLQTNGGLFRCCWNTFLRIGSRGETLCSQLQWSPDIFQLEYFKYSSGNPTFIYINLGWLLFIDHCFYCCSVCVSISEFV